MTEGDELINEVVQNIRDENGIDGQSAADWKLTAEAIALKYVPELQSKKRSGRRRRGPKLFAADVVATLADVAYYKHKYKGISDRDAVEYSATSLSTFKRCKRIGSVYWQHFLNHPENMEALKQLCSMLRTDAKEIISKK